MLEDFEALAAAMARYDEICQAHGIEAMYAAIEADAAAADQILQSMVSLPARVEIALQMVAE